MNNQEKKKQNYNSEIDIDIGDHEIIIKKRYEFYYTLNDILIAVWFIIGSTFFFWEGTKEAGTWLFLIGSLELLIRPFIRISRNIHLQRISTNGSDSSANDWKISEMMEETQQKVNSLEREIRNLKNNNK
ncbi:MULTISPECIES: YrhK family protein [Virgibacillus]|uniref:YrhK domain-containing protein n=2 Tax=Virgibacillus TaxID=84406 RepID=A0A024QE94_9BACI|nr:MULTISPECIES: YrhK family protein [Virgibacillus]EQB35310.1 hypothetical protein M948_19615 [Virgibacillus sp. CM-4]MYL42661.1 hypothetical protein [Virgibacillus massiliensis]CDQ40547.1 hypothetical protein BN990_02872 [Virgibacillus massiliensis]